MWKDAGLVLVLHDSDLRFWECGGGGGAPRKAHSVLCLVEEHAGLHAPALAAPPHLQGGAGGERRVWAARGDQGLRQHQPCKLMLQAGRI